MATTKKKRRVTTKRRSAVTRGPRKTAKKAAKPRAARPSAPAKVGPVNEWMELRRSKIQGVGGFARVDIPKGTRIIEYAGEKISNAEADRRYDEVGMQRHHTFLFILNKRQIIDAARGGNAARFINHSCGPNCEAIITRGKIWIEAKKNIPAGTELVYDYEYDDDPKYTKKDLEFYGCRCGSPNCRGTIVKTRRKLK
jgi:SET domain-containing protein